MKNLLKILLLGIVLISSHAFSAADLLPGWAQAGSNGERIISGGKVMKIPAGAYYKVVSTEGGTSVGYITVKGDGISVLPSQMVQVDMDSGVTLTSNYVGDGAWGDPIRSVTTFPANPSVSSVTPPVLNSPPPLSLPGTLSSIPPAADLTTPTVSIPTPKPSMSLPSVKATPKVPTPTNPSISSFSTKPGIDSAPPVPDTPLTATSPTVTSPISSINPPPLKSDIPSPSLLDATPTVSTPTNPSISSFSTEPGIDSVPAAPEISFEAAPPSADLTLPTVTASELPPDISFTPMDATSKVLNDVLPPDLKEYMDSLPPGLEPVAPADISLETASPSADSTISNMDGPLLDSGISDSPIEGASSSIAETSPLKIEPTDSLPPDSLPAPEVDDTLSEVTPPEAPEVDLPDAPEEAKVDQIKTKNETEGAEKNETEKVEKEMPHTIIQFNYIQYVLLIWEAIKGTQIEGATKRVKVKGADPMNDSQGTPSSGASTEMPNAPMSGTTIADSANALITLLDMGKIDLSLLSTDIQKSTVKLKPAVTGSAGTSDGVEVKAKDTTLATTGSTLTSEEHKEILRRRALLLGEWATAATQIGEGSNAISSTFYERASAFAAAANAAQGSLGGISTITDTDRFVLFELTRSAALSAIQLGLQGAMNLNALDETASAR